MNANDTIRTRAAGIEAGRAVAKPAWHVEGTDVVAYDTFATGVERVIIVESVAKEHRALIAASPVMRDALRGLLSLLSNCGMDENDRELSPEGREAIRQARAAIARAEGRTP